jgi:hypothetical protein
VAGAELAGGHGEQVACVALGVVGG